MENLDQTFDPADWEEFRKLAHRMLDDTIDHLRSLRERPAWRPLPDEVRAALNEPLPVEGVGEEAAYETFAKLVRPYPSGNLHPRFFGWAQGNGTPLGMMADMLAAALNPHLAGFDHAPAQVEHQVIRWLAEIMGMPASASGLFVTGGTMANTLGLAVARHARAGFDVRQTGLHGGDTALRFYGSSETHGWARKASEFLGMGNAGFRRVAVDDAFRIDLDDLRTKIRDDREAGFRPICIIGTAGTINTGATDDLRAIASICREEGLWFHVDGAFGAWARASEKLRPIVAGIEEADSIAFDLHKWAYLPFECACVLVRDPAIHTAAFATSPAYLADMPRGTIAGGLPFADRGLDLTRGFKALKAWMALKAYGVNKLSALIEQNVAQAQYLATIMQSETELELLAPVALNVVCFRFNPNLNPENDLALPRLKLSEEELTALNQELLIRIQESGSAVPSSTLLGGRYAIRACITNHRTRREDLDELARAAVRIGRDIAAFQVSG